MSNDLISLGVDVFNAISALKLKRHQLVSTREGVIIRQQGRPDLLLTHEAARQFAQGQQEAQYE